MCEETKEAIEMRLIDRNNPGTFVINTLNEFFRDQEIGFDVFIVMKATETYMKRFLFYEDGSNNFKEKIEKSIVQAVKDKFLADTVEYVMAENIADNQNKFYVIEQNNGYVPFDFLKKPEEELGIFSVSERDEADAIVFRFRRDGKSMWVYQYIYPTNVPNKKNENFLAKVLSTENYDRFVEMDDVLFPITKKINLLVIGDYIISGDTSLMQRHFGFDTFIRTSAAAVVAEIDKIKLVSNQSKLVEYVERTQTKYAKKMMRIKNYHVIDKTADELLEKISTVARWQDVFEIVDNKIYLRTYQDVENLIDLFDERFTTSLITGDEFDTDVKKLATPTM